MNNNGSLDTGFTPASGADASVHAVALQSDGKILIAEDFTSYDGTQRYGIARLNTNGNSGCCIYPGLGTRDSTEPGSDGPGYCSSGFGQGSHWR